MIDDPRDPDPSAELDNQPTSEIEGNGDRVTRDFTQQQPSGKVNPGTTVQGNGDRIS